MTTGETWLEHMGVDPHEYDRFGDLAHEVSDAMWDAAEEVLREWKARDPHLRVLADDRCGLWEWTTVPIGTLPPGTEIRYETTVGYRPEEWTGRIRAATEDELQWHPDRVQAYWSRVRGTGRYNAPHLRAGAEVKAFLPIPFDLSALLAVIDAEQGTTSTPAPPAADPAEPILWSHLQPGTIIRYQHHSRARRLAGQQMIVRRGRIERAYPPAPGRRHGQISISSLNKNGTVNKNIGRINLFELDQIVCIEQPAPVKENA